MSHPAGKVQHRSIRALRVYAKAAPRNTTLLQSARYIHLPEIRLHGRWLEALGFNRGDRVDVACEEGRIVITIAEEP